MIDNVPIEILYKLLEIREYRMDCILKSAWMESDKFHKEEEKILWRYFYSYIEGRIINPPTDDIKSSILQYERDKKIGILIK